MPAACVFRLRRSRTRPVRNWRRTLCDLPRASDVHRYSCLTGPVLQRVIEHYVAGNGQRMRDTPSPRYPLSARLYVHSCRARLRRRSVVQLAACSYPCRGGRSRHRRLLGFRRATNRVASSPQRWSSGRVGHRLRRPLVLVCAARRPGSSSALPVHSLARQSLRTPYFPVGAVLPPQHSRSQPFKSRWFAQGWTVRGRGDGLKPTRALGR